MSWRAGIFAVFILWAGPLWAAEEAAEISPWDFSAEFGGGVGNKDNLLLSDFNKESSVFSVSTAELFLLRLPMDGMEMTLFGIGEDRRYWQSTTVDKEQLFIGSLEVKKKLRTRWKAGAGAQYSYTDQMFDASIQEGLPFRVRAKLHRFSGGPSLEMDLPGKRRTEARMSIVRQEFELPLDDSWEVGPKWLFGQKYGHDSDVTAAISVKGRAYDNLAAAGNGDSLRYMVRDFELVNRHYWDEEREWRLRSKLGVDWTTDNGTGFNDYRRWRVEEEIAFERGGFEGTAGVKAFLYEYDSQVGLDLRARRRRELAFEVRLEQEVFKGVRIFVAYEHEWVMARDVSERYRSNTVMAGLEWDVK